MAYPRRNGADSADFYFVPALINVELPRLKKELADDYLFLILLNDEIERQLKGSEKSEGAKWQLKAIQLALPKPPSAESRLFTLLEGPMQQDLYEKVRKAVHEFLIKL